MAFGSVSDILLRITGDPSDAADAIEEVAADLAIFGKQSAEAKATVDTEKAKADLQLLRARLEAIDLDEAEPQVKVKIAEALVEVGVMEHELDKLDGRDVNVDVDVRRGAFERLNALGNSMFGVSRRIRGLSTDSEGLISSLGNVGTVIGPFTARLGELGPILAALAPLIVAVGGAIVALVASLGAATLAVGALGVALGGVFTVGIGFAIAAIKRFKDESDTAGTPANALKTAFEGIGDAAKKLLPAVDPVFTAMASGLNALKPLIGLIAPAFTQFGKAAAGAVQSFVDVLASPAIGAGIANLVRLSSGALQPMAQIAGQLFRIFLNIAQAAMPFLVAGLQDVADALKSIGDSTSDVQTLHGQIGGLVKVLGAWLDLLGAIGGALLAIFSASAGPGTQLVKFLADGAQSLQDWANSAKGQEQIKQFFSDVLPLAKQLAILVGQLVVIFIEVGQILAPVFTPVVQVLNVIIGVVRELLGLFLSLPEPVRSAFTIAAAAAVLFFTGIGEIGAAIVAVIVVIKALQLIFSAVGGAAVSAFNAAIGAAKTAAGAIAGVAKTPINFVLHLPQTAVGEAKSLWSTVKGVLNTVINFVFSVPRTALGIARGLWSGVKSILSTAISFVFSVPRTALGIARGIWSGVKSVISAGISFVLHMPGVGSLVSIAKGIWDQINAALPDIDIHVNIHMPSIPHPHLATGARDFLGGTAVVGEHGPELLNLPPGTDVFNALDTRRILDKLAHGPDLSGALSGPHPAALAVGGGGLGHSQVNHFDIEVPEGDLPDVETTVAMFDMKLKTRGIWSP